MNILIISRHEPIPLICGVERMSLLLLRKFRKDGHNVFSLALAKTGLEQPEDITTDYFPSEDAYAQENIDFLRHYIRENHIDVLLNQYGTSSPESRLFLSCKNVVRITELHIDPEMQLRYFRRYLKQRGGIRRFLIPFAPLLKVRYRRSLERLYAFQDENNDAIVLLSDKYRTFSRLDTPKVYAMPNAVDVLADASLRPEDKEKNILFVGRLDRVQKAPEELIMAFAIVEKKHPDWNFILVGDGPDKEFMMDFARKAGVKNIRFTGHADPFPYYEKSAINCLTSNFEGFPMTIIEGMAFKAVPVVYDSFPVASEIIDDNQNGCLVKHHDRQEMARKLCRLIENPQERCRMAEAAYAKARRQYHIDAVAQRWYSLFNKLLSK